MHLCDLQLCNDLLNVAPKAHSTKKKQYKLILIKLQIKPHCVSKAL